MSTLPYFGPGAGLARLHQLAAAIGKEGSECVSAKYWGSFSREFFHSTASMHLVLWNPASRERKAFKLPTSVISRWFSVNFDSGVRSMSLMIESPREYLAGQPFPSPQRDLKVDIATPSANVTHFVECTHATWAMRFDSGWQVHMKGDLRVAFRSGFVPSETKGASVNGIGEHRQALVVESFDFVVHEHSNFIDYSTLINTQQEEQIPADVVREILMATKGGSEPVKSKSSSPRTDDVMMHSPEKSSLSHFSLKTEKVNVPKRPVNEYGVTLRSMRSLEIIESVCQLQDLIDFTTQASEQQPEGPIDGLRKLAAEYRQTASQSGNATMSRQ